jgi:hypothetical protein
MHNLNNKYVIGIDSNFVKCFLDDGTFLIYFQLLLIQLCFLFLREDKSRALYNKKKLLFKCFCRMNIIQMLHQNLDSRPCTLLPIMAT